MHWTSLSDLGFHSSLPNLQQLSTFFRSIIFFYRKWHSISSIVLRALTPDLGIDEHKVNNFFYVLYFSWHIVMRMRVPKEGSCDPIAPLELPHSLHAFQRVSSTHLLNRVIQYAFNFALNICSKNWRNHLVLTKLLRHEKWLCTLSLILLPFQFLKIYI